MTQAFMSSPGPGANSPRAQALPTRPSFMTKSHVLGSRSPGRHRAGLGLGLLSGGPLPMTQQGHQ